MKFLFTSLLLLTIFVGSISNRAYTQNLSSISSDGSSLTTSNSFVDVSGSSVTIDVTSVNKVLIVATFTGKTTTGSAIATYRIADNADNNINSGEIKRSHSGTYGIGSQVYIFDVNSFSGNRTYTFQHKTDAQTLETTVNLTAIALFDGTNQLANTINQLSSPVVINTSWEAALESNVVTSTGNGGFYVAASIQNAKTSGGSNVVVGEWILQYKKTISGTWTDLSYAVSRSTTGISKGIVNLVGALPNNTTAGDFYFRVAHRKTLGADQIETQACNLVAVSLGTSSGFFPIFTASKSSATILGTNYADVISNIVIPQSNTNLFLHSQYNLRGNGTINSPKFDLYVKQGTTEIFNGTDFYRYLSNSSDRGSGTSSGLVTGLLSGTTYDISLRHSSTASLTLTTENSYLIGFGLNRSSQAMVSPITVNATQGVQSSSFNTLKEAFDAINLGTFRGDITILVNANTTETASTTINSSGTGNANYTSINIYPTNTAVSIAGNFNNPIIFFNGSDNITIDGRINANGITNDLTIINSNTGNAASAIKYYNSAENNSIKYCNIKSACFSSGIGAIYFTSASIGNGNDNNIIEYCNITNAGGNRPINAIFSSGSSGRENSGNIIRNNNFYDFFNSNTNSFGVLISYLSTNWTITENSFYETTTFAPTGSFGYYPIYIIPGTHFISNNYIGGSAPLCEGTAWTINANKAHYFCGIYINGLNTVASTVSGNTIKNINDVSIEDNPWDGIFINSGNVDVTGNTIGATTGTGSITITTPVPAATATISGGVVTGITLLGGGSGYTTAPVITFSTSGSSSPAIATTTISGGVVTAINLISGGSGYTGVPNIVFDGQSNNYSTSHGMIQNSSKTVNITNNNIGSITVVSSNYYSHGFESIYVRSYASICNISYNLLGSLTTANSINVSSSATLSNQKQDVYGIYSSGTGTNIIAGNTISNLTNAYSGTNSGSKARGISTTTGVNTIQNNIIQYITSNSAQTSINSSTSVAGISQTSTTAGQTVSGNTISNLSNTNPSATVDIIGIYYSAGTSGTNKVSENFIHSLSLSSSNTASSIEGITLYAGKTTTANNIINLGGGISTGYKIYGIYENGNSGQNNYLYFNTIYISGNPLTTTSSTYSLYSASTTNTKIFKNNILCNERNGGSIGKHYAIRLAGVANLTIDYNDYFVSGTNGILGYLTTDKTTLAIFKTATGQDVNSLNIDPGFSEAGGLFELDYYFASSALPGITGTGITTDISGTIRNSTPKMGAVEKNTFNWKGSVSTDFANAANWLEGAVPLGKANIVFDNNPDRSCFLDGDRIINNITINQSTDILVLNGHQLTIYGNINLTNSAKIDATTSLSGVYFAGNTAQSIPTGSFVNNIVDYLSIENSFGLSLIGDFTIEKGIALIDGNFAIGPNTLTFNGIVTAMTGTVTGGTSTNMIIGGTGSVISMPSFTLNNLSINRASGVNLFGDLNLVGTLTLTNGTLLIDSASLTLSGNSPVKTNGYIDASNTDATLIFSNTLPITLPTTIFSAAINNLTISGTGGITSNDDLTINGILHLQTENPSSTKGSLDMWNGTSQKTLTMGANATTIGIGDVTGIVKRTSFVPTMDYSFGNQFTTLTFAAGGTMPTEICVKIGIGSAPSWKTTAVQRTYDIIRTGGTGTTVTLSLHYLDNEIQANTESNLVNWDYHTIPTIIVEEHGKANQDITENWVAISNRNITYFATTFDEHPWGLSNKESADFTWQGTPSTDWNDPNNWSGGIIPTITSDVVIPDAATTVHDPILPASTTIRKITIQTGGILNGGSATTLTIASSTGAWVNLGTFNAETSTIKFTHANATIAGTSNFYNVTVANGAGLTPEHDNIMRISNALTLEGTGIIRAALLPNTIEYNGTDQTIINPNGLTPGYYNLILSNSGIKTMPATTLSIAGNLITSDATTVNVSSILTISGNITIGSNSVFNSGNFSHSIGGNFENNGTFNTTSGNNISLNGTLIQQISGSTSTTFDNLTINNNNDITLASNITVNNSLTLTSGNLNLESTTLRINGAINKTAGYINVISTSSLNFGGTNAITLPDNLFSTTPTINNLTIQRGNNVTLGNQNMTVNGLLDLVSGNLIIAANTLTISCLSPTRTNGYLDASNSNATLVFTNPNAIILPANIFAGDVNNLTINSIGGITASSDFTVIGALNLQSENPSLTKGSIDMYYGASFHTLTMGANATTIGAGDVTGIIKRTTLTSGVTYTFGNQFTSAYFTTDGTLPSEMSVKVIIGNAPSWSTGAINREYEIIQTGGSGTKATFYSHYLDNELNGNTEQNLVLWVGLSPTIFEYGRSNFNSTENWVALSNINVAFFLPTWSASRNVSLDEYGTTNTITWNGSLSDSWTSVENWTPNVGPSPTKNIIIPDASSTSNDPTLPAFTEIKTLNLETASILNSSTNAQLTLNGSSSCWTNNGGTFNPSTSNVTFTNAAATISGTTSFYNITIDNNASLRMQSNSTIKIAGEITNNGIFHAVIVGQPTTVEYNGGNQTIVIPNPSTNRYMNLILSGTGTKTMPATNLEIFNDFTISGTANCVATAEITTDGNFTIESGATFETGVFNHNVKGNLINNGTFTATTGSTLTFNSSTVAQIISGSTSSLNLYNLTVNNTFSSGSLTLNIPVSITNALTLTNKNIYSSSTNKINMLAGSTVSGGSLSSFVDGPISKAGTTAFIFPTGNGTRWARVAIGAPTSATTFTAQYFASANSTTTLATSPTPVLESVSSKEYWQLDKTSGSGNATVTLYWEDAAWSGISDCSNNYLRIAHLNSSSEWENNNESVTTSGSCSGASSGSITTNTEVTSFSPFTFGSKSISINPLPIELLSFTGNYNNSNVDLVWTTISETNNAYFTLEKSPDAIEFYDIAKIEGVGNSTVKNNYLYTDNNPYKGINYYRLRQTDFDGKNTTSKVISVDISSSSNKSLSFEVYPNPILASENLTIKISNFEAEKEVLVVVYNILGEEMYSKITITDYSGNSISAIDLGNRLSAGTYLIKGTSLNQTYNKYLIIK